MTIEQLRHQFSGLYKKDVPNNMKNNYDWLVKKIAEKLDNRTEETPAETKPVEQKTQAPKAKPKSKFKILFNGQYDVVHQETKRKQSFRTLEEAKLFTQRHED